MGNKLYIYDSSSEVDRDQAAGRFSKSATLTTLPCGSVAELHKGLGELVGQRKTFTRVLFQTHGGPGRILFNDERIWASDLDTMFSPLPYFLLFPARAKIYFDGCNVADEGAGWKFLEAAGRAFLKSGGGITMGYTSVGFGLPGWLSGHTIHAWGALRFIDFKVGGVEASRFDGENISMANMDQVADAVNKLNAF